MPIAGSCHLSSSSSTLPPPPPPRFLMQVPHIGVRRAARSSRAATRGGHRWGVAVSSVSGRSAAHPTRCSQCRQCLKYKHRCCNVKYRALQGRHGCMQLHARSATAAPPSAVEHVCFEAAGEERVELALDQVLRRLAALAVAHQVGAAAGRRVGRGGGGGWDSGRKGLIWSDQAGRAEWPATQRSSQQRI